MDLCIRIDHLYRIILLRFINRRSSLIEIPFEPSVDGFTIALRMTETANAPFGPPPATFARPERMPTALPK
jgi:hypothetical protein